MIKEKCVEYYFDSRKYSKEEIIESIKQEEKELKKKKIKTKIDIKLNEYGIYVVKLRFLTNVIYGKYKQTRKYEPI